MDAYTKTKGSTTKVGLSARTYSTGGGGCTNGTAVVGSITYKSNSGTFSGFRDPDWKRKVRAVTNATTPASGSIAEFSVSPSSGTNRFWTSSGHIGHQCTAHGGCEYSRECRVSYYTPDSENYASAVVPWPGFPSALTAENLATAKLYDAIIEIQTSLQAGEDIGEARQTANLLRSPMRNLRELMFSTMEGHQKGLGIKRVSNAVRVLADTVLEYRFGVEPLASSIASTMVGLQNRDESFIYRPFDVTGRAKNSNSGSWASGVGHFETTHEITRFRERTVRYRGVWGYKVPIDRRSVNQVLGLQWRHFVPTVWNLIPYSWLADYFTNIGDFANRYAVDWSGTRWCNKTVRTSSELSSEWHDTTSKTGKHGYSGVLSPGSFNWRSTSFQRLTQFSLPSPIFEIDLDLSGRQLQNVAALMLSKIPFFGHAVKKAVNRSPSLPKAFAAEIGRRKERIPYPFHK